MTNIALFVVVAIAATTTEVTAFYNECLTDGLKYSGRPVSMQKSKNTPTFKDVMSAEDCQGLCQENEECNFFTWNSAGHKRHPNTCWLKTDKGKAKTGKANQVSGPKCCPDCFDGGVSYTGKPVSMQKNKRTPTFNDVMSAEECQELCQGYQGAIATRMFDDDEECNFFTWNNANHKKNPNTCWLKTNQGKVKTNKKQADKISGPRCCPPAFAA